MSVQAYALGPDRAAQCVRAVAAGSSASRVLCGGLPWWHAQTKAVEITMGGFRFPGPIGCVFYEVMLTVGAIDDGTLVCALSPLPRWGRRGRGWALGCSGAGFRRTRERQSGHGSPDRDRLEAGQYEGRQSHEGGRLRQAHCARPAGSGMSGAAADAQRQGVPDRIAPPALWSGGFSVASQARCSTWHTTSGSPDSPSSLS